jgi:hypothetical protein
MTVALGFGLEDAMVIAWRLLSGEKTSDSLA